MLESRKNKPYNENKVVTIIGPGTRVTGELFSKGTVRVEGEVHGHLACEDSIVVQPTGRVQADVVAGQVIISGEVHGNVYAQDRLEITNTGKVYGDVTAPRVSFAEGMVLDGKCMTKKPEQSPGDPVRPAKGAAPQAAPETAAE